MKRINIFLTASIFVILAIIFFLSRQVFFYKYEPEYYENWYYHSQWNIPNSTRGIGDGDLYKFIGYKLVEGENPFNINYEVPPFGKYLYGLAEKYIGNPYLISLILYLSSLATLYILSIKLFKNRTLALLASLLFVTTPFIATQIRETMLDLPLMFFFLVHALLFIKYLSDHKTSNLLISGIFLGLATGTKLGVYTPLIVILGLPLIFLKMKKIKTLLLYFCSVFAGYVLSFFCYFIRHPNPFPWLRLHRKVLEFYLNPVGKVDYLNQWRGIFLNLYQGWWQPGQKMALGDWSPLLPLGVILGVTTLFLAIKKRNIPWLYISGLSLIFLVVNTFIPFWPRYLMPVIPLFILLIVFSFRKFTFIILLLAILNIPFLGKSLYFTDISRDVQAVARFISTRAYRELYRSLSPTDKENIPEEIFIQINEDFLEKLQTRKIETEVKESYQSGDKAEIKYQFKYITKYGELEHKSLLSFIRVHNQWKLIWEWDYLYPNYEAESEIIINEKNIPFLRMENKQGIILAERKPWKTVYVIPRLMFDWNKYLNSLSEVTNSSKLEIDQAIKTVIPDQYPRFVGYLDPSLGKEAIDKALSFPGVSLRDNDYAVVEKTIYPSQKILPLIKALHQKNPEIFYTRAEIYLRNNEDEKILIQFKNVALEDTIIKREVKLNE